MTATVQRMDERLDKLEDVLKSCQFSRTAYPAEQNDQPLQRPFGLNCRTRGRNGHKASECFRSLMAIHRGLSTVSTLIHATTTMITFLTESTTLSTPSE